MTDVYDEYKDADGFIYIDYCEYNTFGGEWEKKYCETFFFIWIIIK